MASLANLLLFLLFLGTFSPTTIFCFVNPAPAKVHESATKTSPYHTYIVIVGPLPTNIDEDGHRRWYESFLPSLHAGDSGEPRLIHSYTKVFSGFAAKLADRELDIVAKKPGFIRAFRDRRRQVMTTHTPEFLGLRNNTGFWRDVGYGKGVIVGLLDTGIYPVHPSFDDHGIPPPPTKWKGTCKAARCNNKLIGDRSLVGGEDSGDKVGHGTHTSSTAAGNFISGVSYHGLGAGIAAGIAAGAHIAMYKVCTASGCDESTILVGLDAAIKDGVDVLSISLDTGSLSIDYDPVAVGTFSAVSRGIVVVCAAGNDGPVAGSVTNDAPWLLTVAAGSVDRSFRASVHLSNGKRIDGEALTQVTKSSSSVYPLHYEKKRLDCNYNDVDNNTISGKIVVCAEMGPDVHPNIHHIMGAGAAGVVLSCYEGYTTVLRNFNSSVVQVTPVDGEVLETSAATSMGATLTYNNTLLGVQPSPVVASFSSRGPSPNTMGVLKPDILAPALNILAAWPPNTESGQGPSNIISGTSMATPHISGIAALTKSLHPDWSQRPSSQPS
jgi:subtilisin family serine protease